ncbi:hypothetical protein LJR230_004571 [Trinickia sp. LjRoot230]|uniref:hypothetical protein n=1 Tax=Trinickia sp. LjRoot230 TaxID=3342288 RepID=UPI003ED0F6DB
MMEQLYFFASVAFGFVVWGVVTARYIWPALRERPRAAALEPLLVLHSFRFVGLAFLFPGVVSPDLPLTFARAAGYGDIVAAVLALLALLWLPRRIGIIAVWIFNVWGMVDLLNAFFQANRSGLLAGQLGATYFIPTVIVPLLLITHGLVFRILLRDNRNSSARRDSARPTSRPMTLPPRSSTAPR